MKRIALCMMLTSLGALAGCGDPDGLGAQGTVALTVHQPGQPDGATSFSLPSGTLIDPPPGVGTNFFGTCVRTNNRWTVDISRADNLAGGLRRVVFSLPQGSGAAGGTVNFTLGTSTFAASSQCQATAVPTNDNGVRITGACTGVSSPTDLRTLDAQVNLLLSRCQLQ